MNKPVAMGNCMFATWEQLDVAFDEWAKGYFGEHVRAKAAREENDCCLEVEGLEHKDFEKFSVLFERFDKAGLYDPEYEFETGAVAVQLPGEFARGILGEVYQDAGLRGVGAVQANDVGVFMMEKELDYYKVMTGEYFVEQVIEGAEKHLQEIRDIEKYFASVNLGDYDLGGCEFTREDYEAVRLSMETWGKSMEQATHDYLLTVRDVLDKGIVGEPEESLDEAGLRSMIPIMQREGLTLVQVSEELDYRERVGVKDGSAGWNDNFYDYSTEELEFIEKAWSEIEVKKGIFQVESGVLEDFVQDAEKLKGNQKIDSKDRDLGER